MLHRLLLPTGFRRLCSLEPSGTREPPPRSGAGAQSFLQKLHKKHSLFTSNQPNRQSRQRQVEKYHDPYFLYKKLSHREVSVYFSARVLCQWYNQHASLVYLDMLGGPDAFVILRVNCTGSRAGICSDLTASSKPNAPTLPRLPQHQ